jgi:signal transduction histidine kinase
LPTRLCQIVICFRSPFRTLEAYATPKTTAGKHREFAMQSPARWQRFAVLAVLLLACGVFVAWRHHAYRHERELIEETLHQPAHSVMNAVLGGIQTHRRLGRYFEEQLQGLLDELVRSQDVLAVAIRDRQGRTLLAAGDAERLAAFPDAERGDSWTDSGLLLVESFELQPPGPGPGPGFGLGEGRGGGRGAGRRWGNAGDGGGGPGRGAGGGPPWLTDATETPGPFSGGGTFLVALLFDRTRYDVLAGRSLRAHVFVTGSGVLAVLLLAWAWRASVRLVAAQGRARLLETEARHLRDLGQAAAGLAHETRNPLGLIRGWTQRFAESGQDDADRGRHVQAVIEECDRVTARINQFLAFARPCAPKLAPVKACELADELAVLLQPDLEAKNLRLSCPAAPAAKPLLADRELLRQALFNLVQNAVQFAPAGDVVTIGVLKDADGRYRLEVADHGPGVPEDARPSLFTPYFTTRPNGTGLGLAIVRRIAAAHGWQAAYRPRPGGGAVFALEGMHGGNQEDTAGG